MQMSGLRVPFKERRNVREVTESALSGHANKLTGDTRASGKQLAPLMQMHSLKHATTAASSGSLGNLFALILSLS